MKSHWLTFFLLCTWFGAATAQAASPGAVVAWGRNVEGQASVPVAAQSEVTAIAAGGIHTVVLKADGGVVAWGDTNYGQTMVPATAQSGVSAIAAGFLHTVALKNDGSVVAWGYNPNGQTTVPVAAQSGVTAIAAGGHTVALKSDGSVVAWGYNPHGQTTVPVAAQSGVLGIAAGLNYTVALLTPTIPAIATQPISQMVNAGQSASFTVAATGYPFLSYQWQHDETDILGATNASYTIAHVEISDAGSYRVMVTNLLGSALSSNAMLTVWALDHFTWSLIPSPQFTGVPFTVAIQARDLSNQIITNFVGTATLRGTSGGERITNILGDVVHSGSSTDGNYTDGYSFTPASDVLVTHVRHYYGDKVSIWTDAGVLLASQAVNSLPGTWVETLLSTPLKLSAGVLYRIGVFYPTPITYYFRTDLPQSFSDGTIVQGFYTTGDQFPNSASSKRWYFVDLRYQAGGVAVPIMPAVSGNFINGTWSGAINVSGSATNLILLADDGAGHSGLSNPFDVAARPVILTQPVSQRAFPGSDVFLSVMASGSPPLNYQWQREGTNLIDGERVNGATNSVLSIMNSMAVDSGVYSVIVGNHFGVAMSSNATLTVSGTPVILTQPVSQAVRPGTGTNGVGASLYVLVSGVPPIRYQWRRNGANLVNGGRINGAADSSLFIGNFGATDSGLYSVVVSNSFGTVTSSSATLTFTTVRSFVWSFISSPQARDRPFAVRVEAQDLSNHVVTSFHDAVVLSASVVGGGSPVPVFPIMSGTFVSGVWNGNLSVSQTMPNVVLRADDGLGDFGVSSPFDVEKMSVFVLQPTNQNVLPGTNVTLTALAVGTGPIRYQWRFEEANIPNATNASYSFTNASLTNAHGNFSTLATDDLGSFVSSNALIYVLVRPGIVTSPVAQTVLQGQMATFSVIATGAPPLSYRWLRNGAIWMSNAPPTLEVVNCQSNGSFRVLIMNQAGNVSSASVPLTVLADFDQDGMADGWEQQYGFSTNNAADALLDADGDGMSNRDEFLAGTNPTNALSVLKIVLSATNLAQFSFVAQPNIDYTVQWRSNMMLPFWGTLTDIFGEPLVRTVQVNMVAAPFGPDRYYRIVAPRVP